MADVGSSGGAGRKADAPPSSKLSRLFAWLAWDRNFYATVAVLAGLILALAFSFRHDLASLGRQTVPIDDREIARWQAWADHYAQLFSALHWGEKVGIQTPGHRGSGIVIERTEGGVVARRAFLLAREDPAVVLRLDRDATEDLLGSVPDTDPGEIWQMMKDRLYGRQITVWSDSDLDRLEAGGYLAFMRAIDTRPQGVEWLAIKERLGEPP